jgi:hypothetical protein
MLLCAEQQQADTEVVEVSPTPLLHSESDSVICENYLDGP